MAGKKKTVNLISNHKPKCPKCESTSTLGYLNGRNGKVNYFCSKCSIEATFNVKNEVVSFSELSADGTTKETLVKKSRAKQKSIKK